MHLDSCVIIKLVSREPDSEAYHTLVTGQNVVTSELAVTEVRSALITKESMGKITRQVRLAGCRLFQEKVRAEELVLLPLNRRVLERAGGVIEQCHPQVTLRTPDAIHVASAEPNGGEPMCSSDQQVCQASDAIGLALMLPGQNQ